MWQIFIGSVVLGLIHPLFPNHWLPMIAISKAEKWNQRETISATLISGFAHTLSTIFIGILVGFVGIKLTENYNNIIRIAAPAILVSIGLIYLLLDFRKGHREHHHFDRNDEMLKTKKSKFAVIFSLSVGMFLSPCIEIEAYYFQAATQGWIGILMVSVIYLLLTLVMMTLLVYLGMKGVNRLSGTFFERHEKTVTGIVLIALGIFSYFIEI